MIGSPHCGILLVADALFDVSHTVLAHPLVLRLNGVVIPPAIGELTRWWHRLILRNTGWILHGFGTEGHVLSAKSWI